MKIEIKKLNDTMIDDYLNFFDNTPHSERPNDDECKCYCVWWCSDNHTDQIFNEFLSTKEKRREYACNSIKKGIIQGYLAYVDDKVVGWCNTNTKKHCYNCFCWKNFMSLITKEEDVRIKSIFCFTVSPDMRGKGIATSLLEQVCKDAKNEGFDYVEAYPNKNFQNVAEDFMGPKHMFEKAGFKALYETDNKIVFQKKLL